MSTVLDSELKTYEQQRDHLLAKAEGKFVLIHDDQVVGVYESEMDAISQGYKQFGNVPFLVKEILKVDMPLSFVSGLLGV